MKQSEKNHLHFKGNQPKEAYTTIQGIPVVVLVKTSGCLSRPLVCFILSSKYSNDCLHWYSGDPEKPLLRSTWQTPKGVLTISTDMRFRFMSLFHGWMNTWPYMIRSWSNANPFYSLHSTNRDVAAWHYSNVSMNRLVTKTNTYYYLQSTCHFYLDRL